MPDSHPQVSEASLWRVAYRTVFLVAALAGATLLAIQLQGVIIQIFLATIVACGMSPIVDWMCRTPDRIRGGVVVGWRPSRSVAVLLVYAVLVAGVISIAATVIPPAARDVRDLTRKLPETGRMVAAWATNLPNDLPADMPVPPGLDVGRGLSQALDTVMSQVTSIVGQALVVVQYAVGFLSGALNGVFVLILALYFTSDAHRIIAFAMSFLAPARRPRTQRILGHIGERLGGWLRGQVLLSLIIGGICLVGLLALGVPYAVLLALVAAIGEAVPMVGPVFSAVPAVLVALSVSPTTALLTLGLYVIVQQLENYLIVPRVMERAVSIDPLAVMLALLIGSELMGITGAVLSVPVAAGIAVMLDEIRRDPEPADRDS